MNLVEAQNLAYSIVVAKKEISIRDAAQKAAKWAKADEEGESVIESGLVEFLLGMESITGATLWPKPKELLDELGKAYGALATSKPYALAGHPADPQLVIDVIRHYVVGRMQGL